MFRINHLSFYFISGQHGTENEFPADTLMRKARHVEHTKTGDNYAELYDK